MHDLANTLVPLMIFAIPIVAIWTKHQRKMAEIQAMRGPQVDLNMHAELQALRNEVRSLRDTTMQYDLSFDTALQNMERKHEGLERKVQNMQHDSVSELINRR